MITRFMIDAPQRMQDTWAWVNAFCAFDYGDPVPLAALVEHEDIPPEYRSALADVVSGVRKPDKRAAAKLKVPADLMMVYAMSIDSSVGFVEYIHHHNSLDRIAESYHPAKEPREIIAQWQATGQEHVKLAMKDFKVSKETIKNLMREMRERIDRWPCV
jgi:hypothetical protein